MSAHPEIKLERPRSLQAQITEQMRQQIRSEKWVDGFRLPPTRALAATWGTDASTVHRALVALVKEGLLYRTPGRGTFVRRREERLTCVGIYHSSNVFGPSGSEFRRSVHAQLKRLLDRKGIQANVWIDPRNEEEQARPWEALVSAAQNRKIQA
ncbi:MAG: GntR family transcriptional regulator, partial [Verrucomicrobia bacterium]|nr:GntR family transcriptional regulator [Verrucomicrobiota bacterium]